MFRTASGPHKSWRQQKSKFPHVALLSSPHRASSFSPFLCCKEHNVCCLGAINPSFVLDAIWSALCSLRRRRFKFLHQERCKDPRGGQRTLISSHHCRAMSNVPLLICDKWWSALGFKLWDKADFWVLCRQRTCCEERGIGWNWEWWTALFKLKTVTCRCYRNDLFGHQWDICVSCK